MTIRAVDFLTFIFALCGPTPFTHQLKVRRIFFQTITTALSFVLNVKDRPSKLYANKSFALLLVYILGEIAFLIQLLEIGKIRELLLFWLLLTYPLMILKSLRTIPFVVFVD